MNEIRKTLFELADEDYKSFHAKLIPNVPRERIIGVRTPALRKYAKEIFRGGEYAEFLNELPHKYYEEDNLHAFLVEQINDYNEVVLHLDKFLPFVDNWATCDMTSPACFSKNLDKLYIDACRWIDSKSTYAIRFGVCMLMKYYLDDNFKSEYAEKVAGIKSEEYYIKMVVAWYFASALAVQYESSLPFIEEMRLDKWTHNKAIQKACESYRVSDENKKYLKSLRVK